MYWLFRKSSKNLKQRDPPKCSSQQIGLFHFHKYFWAGAWRYFCWLWNWCRHHIQCIVSFYCNVEAAGIKGASNKLDNMRDHPVNLSISFPWHFHPPQLICSNSLNEFSIHNIFLMYNLKIYQQQLKQISQSWLEKIHFNVICQTCRVSLLSWQFIMNQHPVLNKTWVYKKIK